MPTTQNHTENKKTILLYSPDMDFCLSLSMLLQDRFNIVTTTDDDMLYDLAQSLQPVLLIADAIPTFRLRYRFEQLKEELPGLRIVMFYVSRVNTRAIQHEIRRFVDAAYSKPVDIEELTKCIHTMVWQN